jgi:hypothetical protein
MNENGAQTLAAVKPEPLRERLEAEMLLCLQAAEPNKEKIAIIKVVAEYLGKITPPEEKPMGSKL